MPIDAVDMHVYVKQFPTVAISFQLTSCIITSHAVTIHVYTGEYGKGCAARTVEEAFMRRSPHPRCS